MSKANGAVIYRGPSMLNGKPIIVVATGLAQASHNPKTGDMIQTYIIADGINPVKASQSGADVSVCGDCKHRKANLGSCYVTLIHGPNSVSKGLERGIYDEVTTWDELAGLAAGRIVRLGTYGDPMAVPAVIWQTFLAQSLAHTGYTHQWNNPQLPIAHKTAILSLVMASVDSESEAITARTLGYRYFRVRHASDPLLPKEIVCPASAEANYRRTCATCKACNGGSSQTSIAIIVHGATAKRFLQVIN
jgi:hypothetical protein